MTNQEVSISKKLRLAGIFIILGLLLEGLSLLWPHPLSFLLFLCVGGLFLTVGILIYLFALVSRATQA